MKVMKSNSMMISVQCQTEFSKDIWAKYSWSFSQGNHVRLQHKEDVVHAKQALIAMPKVTIQQIIQPLHLKLALQHLSFSQVAVYKQQLLRESSEAITILQASNSSQTQPLQHTSASKIVEAPTRSQSEAQAGSPASQMASEQVNNMLQQKQVNTIWQQIKHVSQHFKQDRFLQAIIDKRSTAVHYHQHMQQIANVAAHPHSLESVAASERLAAEQTTVHLSDVRKEDVKQPARMVWHERVEARQQQWKQEQEALTEALQKQIITHSEKVMNEPAVQRVTQTTVQRLVHQDLMRYIASQHIKVSTNQIVQLKKLSIQDVVQKELRRIEQRLSKEHITLHYAEHTVKRKRGRPKKENNQLAQERQAVTQHINRKRKMASVLSRVKDEPLANITQLSSKPAQLTSLPPQLPTLTEQRIISVSELWLNKVKSKQQLTSLSLIHLTQQVSDITGKRGTQASARSSIARQAGNMTMQGSNMTHRSSAQAQQASYRSSIARQASNAAANNGNIARKDSNAAANNGNIAPQSSTAPQQGGNVPLQAGTAAQQHGNMPQQVSNTAANSSNMVQQGSDIARQADNARQQEGSMSQQASNTAQQEGSVSQQAGTTAQQHGNMPSQSDTTAQQHGNMPQQSSNTAAYSDNVLQQASAQEIARIAADAASGKSANEERSDSNALSNQQQLEEQSSAEVTATWRVNQQLQAKIEHVHVRSSQWLKHSITKHMKSVLASDVSAAPLSRPHEDNMPALQAKWQQKQSASQQTVLLTKLQERMKVRQQQKIEHEVITLNAQQAVIIHTQSQQPITLTTGHSVSLYTLSHKWGTRIQKLASPDRQSTFMQKALAQQSLLHKEQRDIEPSAIVARKLLRTDVTLQGIEKQRIEKRNERSVHYTETSSTTLHQTEQSIHEQHILKTMVTPIVKPIVRQQMAILHKENCKLPAILNQIQRTQAQPVDLRQPQRLGARQVDKVHNTSQAQRTGVSPANMSAVQQVQAQRTHTEQVNTSQVERTGMPPVSMSQAQRAQASPANSSVAQQANAMTQVQHAQAQQVNMTQAQRTAVSPVNMSPAQRVQAPQANMTQAQRTKAQRSRELPANMIQAQRTQAPHSRELPASTMTQAQRTQAPPAHLTQAKQLDLHQAVAARTNMAMASHLSHAKAAKPMKAETARQDAYQEQSITQPLSLKRVELDTVKKHVSLLVKDDHKGKQKQNTEPIAVMQTHIKKLEEQIVQQQQQLQDIRNPVAIKQLSNQIYAELSRKIKFDNQRLGR